MSFFEQDEYSIADIQDLISGKFEESLKLEFKGAAALGTSDSKKKEISKDISSFANTVGGIIIYGLAEKDHIASSLDPVDGNVFTKEWVENVISTNIYRNIEGLEVIPIRFEDDISTTIYIVKISPSEQAPHMAKDFRFYKRSNFKSEPMQEYEVRNTYSKLALTYLEIERLHFSGAGSSGLPLQNKYNHFRFLIFPIIKNTGSSIEKSYKTEIKISKDIIDQSKDYSNGANAVANREEGGYLFYVFPGEDLIFPGEEMAVNPIRIKLNSRNSTDPSSLIIGVKLYFSNGKRNESFNLSKILDFNGKRFSEISFS